MSLPARGSTLLRRPARQTAASRRAQFAADLHAGLGGEGPRTIPSQYLYDAVGSALFDAITRLPEYGLTRADERLLRTHAEEIAALTSAPLVAELGSGSGRKTRGLLEALARRGPVHYRPIDVSAEALRRCRMEMARLRDVRVAPLERSYLDGLAEVASSRGGAQPLLVLFLGSTIGNFLPVEAIAFLREARSLMRRGDALLLGTDLQDDEAALRTAYDDPAGVTAAFNRNVLTRINRDLNGRFDPRAFDHRADWNERDRQVEMHLVSSRVQEIAIPGADLVIALRRGESIRTEVSAKFDRDRIGDLAEAGGFRIASQWIDRVWPFAETLLVAS